MRFRLNTLLTTAVVTVGMLLGAITASAAGLVQTSVTCPVTEFTLIPAGAQPEISDFIVSTDAATQVQIKFNPPEQIVMDEGMNANQTVVRNLRGRLKGEMDQALSLTCTGSAEVAVTVVGLGEIEEPPPPDTERWLPGKWEGPGVCLFVSLDGRSVTNVGSTCPGRKAFSVAKDGRRVDGGIEECVVDVSCAGTWEIRDDGSFECGGLNGFGGGYFTIGEQSAAGAAFDRNAVTGFCLTAWAVTPFFD